MTLTMPHPLHLATRSPPRRTPRRPAGSRLHAAAAGAAGVLGALLGVEWEDLRQR